MYHIYIFKIKLFVFVFVSHRDPHKSSHNGVGINSDMCSHKKNMVNAFNEYFATICTNNDPFNNTVPHTNYLKAVNLNVRQLTMQ